MYEWIPTRFATAAELAVIDSIFTAYMSCNDQESFEWEVSPTVHTLTVGTVTAMGLIAEAGRRAFREIGVTDRDLWSEMIYSGENATYIYRLYIENAL